jgi:hypothetical protein
MAGDPPVRIKAPVDASLEYLVKPIYQNGPFDDDTSFSWRDVPKKLTQDMSIKIERISQPIPVNLKF